MIDYRTGDALALTQDLADNSIDLVATSPPFLALRNYGNLPGQYGQEPTPAHYLASLLHLVDAIRRPLTEHGSIAIELGDTYAGSGGSGGDWLNRDDGPTGTGKDGQWPLAKSLCGIPTLFAWSLAYGRNLLAPDQKLDPWRIRNVVIWNRNNPPVGALGDKVRPATSYITIATRSTTRWFDLDAIRGDSKKNATSIVKGGRFTPGQTKGDFGCTPNGTPPTDYWQDQPVDLTITVNTQGSHLPHFATWPPELARRLILSMAPPKVCRTCHEPTRRIVQQHSPPNASHRRHARNEAKQKGRGLNYQGRYQRGRVVNEFWTDCGHDNYRRGAVLDPFAGTGTTLAVADIYDRDAIGFDLDPANTELLQPRIAEVRRSLKLPVVNANQLQLTLE